MADSAMARTRKKATFLGDRLVKTAEVSFGAFAASAISTRIGGAAGGTWFGMPVELVSALLLYTVAVLGDGTDRWTDDLMTVGDGAFAAYMANLGRQAGARARVTPSGWETGRHLEGATGQANHLQGGTGQEDEDIQALYEMAYGS